MFEEDIPNEDLQAIQKLASNYFMDKLQKKITESAIKQGYTQDDFDAWLNDPNQ